jgi:hypothetical protein
MAKKKKLPTWATTVTPFSKMLALSMLVILPILGFYYGMYYQQQMDNSKQPEKVQVVSKTSHACSQPPDGQVICRTNSDCPSNYSCTQAGPIRADGQNHKTCWKNGHAVPL